MEARRTIPLFVPYPQLRAGLLLFAADDVWTVRSAAVELGGLVRTRRIFYTLANLGLVEHDPPDEYALTEQGIRLLNSLNGPQGRLVLQDALLGRLDFRALWSTFQNRSSVVRSAQLAEVLHTRNGLTAASARNLASVLLSLARQAGLCEPIPGTRAFLVQDRDGIARFRAYIENNSKNDDRNVTFPLFCVPLLEYAERSSRLRESLLERQMNRVRLELTPAANREAILSVRERLRVLRRLMLRLSGRRVPPPLTSFVGMEVASVDCSRVRAGAPPLKSEGEGCLADSTTRVS